MIVVYMIAGTLAGIVSGIGVGAATGSILLALLAWSVVGAGAVVLLASVVYLRQTRQTRHAQRTGTMSLQAKQMLPSG